MNAKKEKLLNKEEFELFKQGDEKVFRNVFEEYHQMLYNYACTYTGCSFQSEDAVQEAYIQLFKYCKDINNPEQIYPFLFTVTKRCIIKMYRKNLTVKNYIKNIDVNINVTHNQTENLLNAKVLNEIIQDLIQSLPEKEKDAYTLNKIHGLSYSEISDFTGNSRNTIKNQIISASKKIKLKLAKFYFLIIVSYIL